MERKTLIGVLLLISGLSICAASLWMLAETFKVAGISVGTTDSPKVGMAAGVLAIAVGIACFVMKDLEKLKNIMLAVVLISLILAIPTLALAIKERMDIKKVEDALALASELQKRQGGQRYGSQRSGFENMVPDPILQYFDWLKIQLIVLIVVGTLACLFEIVSLVFVFKLQPSQMSRDAMQMHKPC